MPFNTSSPRHTRKFSALLRMLVCSFFLFSGVLGFGQNPDYEWQDSESLGSASATNLDGIVIAVDTDSENNIYALTFRGEVFKFDSEGNPDGSFNLEGSFEGLVDMAINSNDEIYVAHYEGREILAFDLSGNELNGRRQETSYFKPLGIDFDNENNLFVVEYNDGTGAESDKSSRLKIYYYDGSTSANNLLANRLVQPYRVAVADSGDFYISHIGDDGNGEVLFFGNSFNYIETIENLGSPGSIEIDYEGFVYIIDYDDKVNFAKILEQDLGYLLGAIENIKDASNNGEFSIKIFDSENNYIKPIEDEIQLPIDLSFTYCSDKLAVLNSSITRSSIFTQLNFELEIYNRTPSFDTEDPVANCIAPGKEFTLQNDSIIIVPDDIDDGSTDNCEVVGRQVTPSSFTTTGDKEITLTVADAAGNTDECTTTIKIVGDEEEPTPPEAICNDITIELDENGETMLTAAEVYNGDANEYDLNIDQENFDCSDIGENTIILTVTDEENDLSDTCEAIITVEDNRSPEIECQGDITTSTEAGEDFAVVTFSEPEYSDNCNSSIEQTQGLPSGSQFEVGTHTIEFTVTDSSNNTTTCSFEITVEEPEPSEPEFEDCPTYIQQNVDANECQALVIFDEPTASDDSGELAVELISDLGSGDLFPVGSTTVEYEATGENGETVSCSFEVVVVDNETPEIISCPEDIEVEITSDEDSAIVEYDEPEFTDNCDDNLSLTLLRGPASGNEVGPGMYEVEYEVSDESGNTSTCTFSIMVTMEGQEDLEIDCINHELILDENGEAFIEAETLYAGNREDLNFSLSQDSFDCSDLGVNTLTLTAINPATGAMGSCQLSLEVMDVNTPIAQCVEDFTLNLGSSGQASLSAVDLNLNSSDNCGIENLEIDKTTFTTADLGENTVTLTVTDAAGNFDTCEVSVRVTDEEEETEIECVDEVAVNLDENGEVRLVLEDLYTGNANGLELEVSQLEFDCSDLGENTVIFSWSGEQEGSCEIPVIIEDDIEPVLRTESISLQLSDEGLAEISPEDLDAGSYDNCGELNFSLGQNIFTCKDVGSNMVSFTATDAAGNTTSRNVEVFVNADLGTCSETGRDFDYLFIYPNPTNREFKVYTPDGVEIERIIVFDKRGRFIAEKEFIQNEELKMELEGVQNSVYTLQIFTNEGEEIRRLIIRK